MEIFVNKEKTEVKGATTLAELLEARDVKGPGIAVAVDGKVVKRADWATTVLSTGMEITVITAVCGG